ncbi:MAG TPA: peptidoglycan DD-metalloendopeptidase family protein [Trinickia sp.]|jgi:lipoprotein NlpD|nr:peptidoglycan DD-metalloendopeptidase family protein [Trinickia sp.]
MKIVRSRTVTAQRARHALDIANIRGMTTRLEPRAFALAFLSLATAVLASGCANDQWFGGAPARSAYAPPSTVAPHTGVQAGYYRVNPGDTLQSVAAAFGQRAQDIAEWNRLPAMATLVPGQVLRVAPPVGANLNANAPGALPIRLAWPAYGQVLKPSEAGGAHGIVIAGSDSELVKAAADGAVIFVGNGINRYKSLIVIKHSDSLVTAYGVNGMVRVSEGETVKKGQIIAEMGADANGRSSLEFEIRREGKPIDPLAYLPR